MSGLDRVIRRHLSPLLGAVLSLIAIYMTGIHSFNFGDAPDYVRAGLAIASGEAYPRTGTLPFFRPPGYPFIISIVAFFSVENLVLVLKLFNVMMHSLTTYLIFRLGKICFSSRIAHVGSIFYALNPFSIYQTTGLSTEPLTALLFTAFVFLVTKLGSIKNMLLLATVSIFLSFTRPEYFFVVLPILLFCLFHNNFGKAKIAIILILKIISVALWSFMNFQATGRFILFTDAANYHLWMGSLDLIRENYAFKNIGVANFDELQLNKLLALIEEKTLTWGDKYTQGSIGDRSDLWLEAFKDSISDQGLVSYVYLLLFKGLVFWRPFLNPASYELEIVFATLPLLVVILIALTYGSIRLRNNTYLRPILYCYLFAFAVLTCVHMLQLPDQRYKIPVVLPISCLLLGALVAGKLSMIMNIIKRRLKSLSSQVSVIPPL